MSRRRGPSSDVLTSSDDSGCDDREHALAPTGGRRATNSSPSSLPSDGGETQGDEDLLDLVRLGTEVISNSPKRAPATRRKRPTAARGKRNRTPAQRASSSRKKSRGRSPCDRKGGPSEATSTEDTRKRTDEDALPDAKAALPDSGAVAPRGDAAIVQASHQSLLHHVVSKYGEVRARQAEFVNLASKMSASSPQAATVKGSDDGAPQSSAAEDTAGLARLLLSESEPKESLTAEKFYTRCRADLDGISRLLLHGPHNEFPSHTPHGEVLERVRVEQVSRAWEERFLHEPRGYERACVNATARACFASAIESNGVLDASFALCEFYTEKEYREIEKSAWTWPETRRPCLLCLRNSVYARFMRARCENRAVSPSVHFSPICNMVDVPGEYCTENVFVSRTDRYEGVVLPVVIPCIGDYTVVTDRGTRALLQNLPRPEDGASGAFFF